MSMYGHTADDYDRIFPFNPDVVRLIEEYMPPRGSRILDIGCGTGRYAGKLSGRYRTVGIDTDARSIEIARSRFPGTAFFHADLFSYMPGDGFDLIFCIGNVVSHIPGRDFRPFVRRVRSFLAESGVWLFHTINWDMIVTMDGYDFPVLENEGLRFTRAYRNISDDGVDFITELSDGSGGGVRSRITLYPHTASRIEESHEGFERLALFGNYRKDPFCPGDISRVYVFRKVG